MTLLPIVTQDMLPPAPATKQHAPNTHRLAIIPNRKMVTRRPNLGARPRKNQALIDWLVFSY